MTWTNLVVAPCGTHHLSLGIPAYQVRFGHVQKFHSPGLAPVGTGREAWHILPDGSPAYARRFRRTFGFYEERAAVVGDDGWHHIDAAGCDAYPQRYAWCGNFQEGLCSVRQEDATYVHIDTGGRVASPARWRYAGDYRDGVAVVQEANGLSTHVDRFGSTLHDRWFLDLDVFHKGFARARDGAGWTHVDRRGEPIYAARFASVEPFYNGQSRVERFDGGLQVIDETGASVLELRCAGVR